MTLAFALNWQRAKSMNWFFLFVIACENERKNRENVRSMQQHQYNASSSTSTSSTSSNSSMLNLRCIEAKRSSKTASTLKTADQISALNILYNINAFSFSIPVNGPMLTYTSFTRSKREAKMHFHY